MLESHLEDGPGKGIKGEEEEEVMLKRKADVLEDLIPDTRVKEEDGEAKRVVEGEVEGETERERSDQESTPISNAGVQAFTTAITDNKTTAKPKKKKARLTSKKKKASAKEADEREESVIEEPNDEDGEEHGEGEDEDDEKLYCVCKAKFHDDEVRSMLACDSCDDWYHASCMGIGEEQVKFVDQFICSLCESITSQRTTMKRPCSRTDCSGIAPWPLSKFCSQMCGMTVAGSRMAKVKHAKGGSLQKTTEKLLQAPLIKSAKKTDGKIVWMPDQDKKGWLESVMGQDVSLSGVDDATRLRDMTEVEELTRLERRKRQVEEKSRAVNLGLNALASRVSLLSLAEDRAGSLELIGEEEGDGQRGTSVKKSKKKKVKEEEVEEKPAMQGRLTGQLRCGYDERLSWDDVRFQTWSQTPEAKIMLEGQAPLDGTLFIEGKESGSTEGIKICGQSKRKCKRHSDWSVIRGADMEAEKDMQTDLFSLLWDEDQALEERINELKTAIRDGNTKQEKRDKEQDIFLAKQLAQQGTRRANTILIS